MTCNKGERLPATLVFLLAIAVASSLAIAPGVEGLLGALLACAMLAIAAIDAVRFRIPDMLTSCALLLAIIRAGLAGEMPADAAILWTAVAALIAAAPFFALLLVYRHFRGREGLGLGDVKLAAVAGAWLEGTTLFAVVEGAALAAIAAYLLTTYRRGRRLDAAAVIPFGVFFAPAVWLGWLAEQWLRGAGW